MVCFLFGFVIRRGPQVEEGTLPEVDRAEYDRSRVTLLFPNSLLPLQGALTRALTT